MEALGLGEVEDFPFLDPPDRRQVRDGMALLHELGALDLDGDGPAQAADARSAAGSRSSPSTRASGGWCSRPTALGCADEVVVIAAALSIQDPRVRPARGARARPTSSTRASQDERSDFLAYLNLWRHLREQQSELSGNQFRKRCHAEYLHYLRVREWQDLAGQLRQAARAVGVTINEQPAEPDDVHRRAARRACCRTSACATCGRREYDGARGARFAISPGSALARKPPAWVMVAELVETARLWGRTAAQIQPRWIEPLAGHLLKRTYDAPHWERKRGSVVATERATLFGAAGRRRAQGRLRRDRPRAVARAVHPPRARRGRLDDAPRASSPDNARVLEEVEELEHRARRRDILAGDEAIFAFYDARIPADVVSGRALRPLVEGRAPRATRSC